ncbi:hypothetical protein BKH46_08750 [Helicobacter sp. 12S02634-8]|uniref:hypothetical protein n=1 Tax=Helicobacter sp. 12S02634-8 TaxID=1476199 RepID=UPI000BA65C36|nr:hypothetical protein [Helicobacter sp. 12S02634-8]PAF46157.1 hypothetical protein BKH46_08750 [Helicobacter sp. 12S02634-8]
MEHKKYAQLFSEDRISSYESIEEHDRNLDLIASITKDLAIIELVFRNRIDQIMLNRRQDWIRVWHAELLIQKENGNLKNPREKAIFYKIDQEFQKKENSLASHNHLISRMMFGFWIEVAFYILQHRYCNSCDLIDVSNIDLKKYSKFNEKLKDNNLKLLIILALVQKIRNRAFHWENLLKNKERILNNYKIIKIPNIYTAFRGFSNGIYADKIEVFLKDVLNNIDNELN